MNNKPFDQIYESEEDALEKRPPKPVFKPTQAATTYCMVPQNGIPCGNEIQMNKKFCAVHEPKVT